MGKFYKIAIIICLVCLPLLCSAQKKVDMDSDRQGVELVINGEKVTVQTIPFDGVVEVFNVLGTKVTTFVVSSGVCNSRINLPKGYYILKSDNTTKKIVVK